MDLFSLYKDKNYRLLGSVVLVFVIESCKDHELAFYRLIILLLNIRKEPMNLFSPEKIKNHLF